MIPSPPRGFRVPVVVGDSERVMHVHDWGEPHSRHVVVCVHGLTRNGRDFDVLASALSAHVRVLCPDVPGRGLSDWLARVEDYAIPVYVRFMLAMLEHCGVNRCDWVGTSMGGLIGLALAAMPERPIARFVINDVGPVIEPAALARIGAYVGRKDSFASFPEVMAAAAPALEPFGPLTDAERQHLLMTSYERRSDGRWYSKIDPKIGEAFLAAMKTPPPDLWPLWRAARARGEATLVLRGEHSDLLSRATAEAMIAEDTLARLIEVPGTGHAPMLMDTATVEAVVRFLLDGRLVAQSAK
ncbi:MAG: alpha/beta fold hydrolase [Casimicrobiaceae bacterium]